MIDNIFIPLGLAHRQLFLEKPLFLWMVDFSKAFNFVNRHILFYKLMKAGCHSKIIDTLKSLYRKAYFKVKCNGLLSSSILDHLVCQIKVGMQAQHYLGHTLVILGD